MSARRYGVFAAYAACLVSVGCESNSNQKISAPARSASADAADASYDWRVLMLAPFGTTLKESPVRLHEVLLFDESAARRAVSPASVGSPPRSDNDAGETSAVTAGGEAGVAPPGTIGSKGRDCFATDASPPRFMGRVPKEYLWCFEHDRLDRVAATVWLPASEAQAMLVRACALWSGGASESTVDDSSCGGRQGDTRFDARLQPAGSDADAATRPLSLVLARIVPSEP